MSRAFAECMIDCRSVTDCTFITRTCSALCNVASARGDASVGVGVYVDCVAGADLRFLGLGRGFCDEVFVDTSVTFRMGGVGSAVVCDTCCDWGMVALESELGVGGAVERVKTDSDATDKGVLPCARARTCAHRGTCNRGTRLHASQ